MSKDAEINTLREEMDKTMRCVHALAFTVTAIKMHLGLTDDDIGEIMAYRGPVGPASLLPASLRSVPAAEDSAACGA